MSKLEFSISLACILSQRADRPFVTIFSVVSAYVGARFEESRPCDALLKLQSGYLTVYYLYGKAWYHLSQQIMLDHSISRDRFIHGCRGVGIPSKNKE